MLMAALGMTMALATSPVGHGHLFDPVKYKPDVAGPPTQVLVLGTAHLSKVAHFRQAALQGVLDRLAAYRPQVITIEGIAGLQCAHLKRFARFYDGAAKTYCYDTAPARKSTGLDVGEAVRAAQRILDDWPARPSAGQRRHLAAVFLAAGNPVSASVQWLQLPVSERRPGDGLDAPLVHTLDGLLKRHNEDYALAARLAARLGLQQVFPVDDHTADSVDGAARIPGGEKAYEKALDRIWNGPFGKRRQVLDAQLEAGLGTRKGALALYRRFNAPGYQVLAFRSGFGAALQDRSRQMYGRRLVGWWETRNLRMVANVRAVLASRPGVRALCIVGVSHKGYFDAYLHMMQDVQVVDARAVLG